MKLYLNKQRAMLAVVALLCFIAVFAARPYLADINSSVNGWAATIQTGSFTDIAKLIDLGFDTKVLLIITLPLVGLLLYKGSTLQAGLLVGAMGADALLLQAAKTFITSPRPTNALITDLDNSFPSGHLTSTIVFIGMLTYLAWQNRKTIHKLAIAAVGPALIIIVGFDRIYLNMHWLSDILAAPFIALFIIAATILILETIANWHKKRQTAPNKGSPNPKTRTLSHRAITPTAQIPTGD
ncbi:MAG TPA: phosphatase PAP2 family protein, partial [Oculatellaceae cyanobacterium]